MPDSETVSWQIGPLQIWCKSTEDEFWLAYEYEKKLEQEISDALDTIDKSFTIEFSESDQVVAEKIPEKAPNGLEAHLQWQRWTLKKRYRTLFLKPIFPDLPVVIKPKYPFRLVKGIGTKIYVRLPLWVQIIIGKVQLIELPVAALSKTWFGSSTTEGELCYWISTSARKEIPPAVDEPFWAICPIQIINRSDDDLLVEKICHRVGRLSLFRHNEQFWANEITARYRGKTLGSDLEIAKSPPEEVKTAELISQSREDAKLSLTAKTFASLKELSGLGFLNR